MARHFSRLLALLLVLAGPRVAVAQTACPEIKSVSLRASVDDEPVRAQRIAFARADQKTTLHVILEATLDGKRVRFGELPGDKRLRPPGKWPEACPVTLTWFKIEPLPVSYNNAYSAPPANLEMAETAWGKGWTRPADVHPTRMHDAFPNAPNGYGTMRYKVVAAAGKQETATPGIECRSSGAPCPDILTVALRPDDTYLGYLHELLNTPYIYGSKRIRGGHQSDLLVGSDCADFAVYGKRRQRSRKAFGYTYTGGLYKLASKRTPVHLDDQGYYVDKKGRRLSFSDDGDVQPGDLLNLPNGHVGVLFKDDGDGLLDTGDYLMHTLFRAPEIVPIKDCRWSEIDGKEVLRLKK